MKKHKRFRIKPTRLWDILSREDRKVMSEVKKSLEPEVLTHGVGHQMQNRFIPIEKIDEEKRLVFGKATKATLDNQEEIVEWPATKEAAPDFMKFGNLREMHRGDSAAGSVVDMKLNDEDQEVAVVAKVVDNDAWQKVKEKVYKGFSIGGRALKRVKEFVPEIGKTVSKVKKYVWTELSLVDRPAHPDCVFTLVKRDDTSFCDPLSQDIRLMQQKVESLKPRILTDGEIAKLDNGSFALVRKRKRRGKLITERFYPITDKPHAIALLKILGKLPGFTAKEKFIIHGRCCKIVKNSHEMGTCPFCMVLEKMKKGGDNNKVTKAERRAAALLREAVRDDEDYEPSIDAGDQVISETQHDARQKKQFSGAPASSDLEGSKYPDQEEEEGPYFYDEEDYYPGDEDFEDGVPTEHGEGNERLGYEVGINAPEERTHIFDTEAQRGRKAAAIDPEDKEVYFDEDFEGEEDYEACPYCSQTLANVHQAGNLSKRAVADECPGCGTVWSITPRLNMEVNREVPPMVRKTLGIAGQDLAVMRQEIAKRDDQINALCDMIEGAEGVESDRPIPMPRKIAKRHAGDEGMDEEELSKADAKVRLDKALQMRAQAVKENRELTAPEEAECTEAVDASIRSKMK